MDERTGKTYRMRKNFLSEGGVSTNQRGTALFIAIMMLSLVTGIGLLSFNVSSTELLISNYGGHELASTYLTESGVDLVLGWATYPERSPDPDFFKQLPTKACMVTNSGNTPYDFRVPPSYFLDPSIPFSEIGDMGNIVDIIFYKSQRPDSLCTIEVKSVSTKGSVKRVRVDITRSDMRPITAGVQGLGNPTLAAPVWVHWGEIRYKGQAHLGTGLPGIARIPDLIEDQTLHPPDGMPYLDVPGNEDHWLKIHVEQEILQPTPHDSQTNLYEGEGNTLVLDTFNLNDMQKMIMQYGDYYVVSCSGILTQNGVDKGTFDEIFYPASQEYRLAWIDLVPGACGPDPDPVISLGGGSYKGYFYFSGDITIQGGQAGQSVAAASPPWPNLDSPRRAVPLSDINMDGLLYVKGKINLGGSFSVYGSAFSEHGFTGEDAARLEVWYNHSFKSAIYSGLPPIVLLKGTWKALPNSDV